MKKEILIVAIIIVILFGIIKNKRKIQSMLTRGYRNNNPGNIIKTPGKKWIGEIDGSDTRFKTFKDMVYGYRAIFVVLNSYLNRGVNTIEKIITTYAPSHENDTNGYTNFISNRVGIAKNIPIAKTDYATLRKIVESISRFENGIEPDKTDVKKGFDLWVKTVQ